MVKKERPRIINKTVLTKMLPQSYQACFQNQLKATQYVTLQILVGLLQFYKQVSIELLATLMPEPILFESRRRSLQRFAKWLKQKGVYFCLRQKQGQYIQQSGSQFKRLESLGLTPGISCYLENVKVTKQKGFNQFNIAAKWKRGYRRAAPQQGWYILTNMESEKAAVKAYKSRSGIEAMFKDCKTGGYNLEGTHASEERLINLVLLIAIAYICALVQGKEIKQKKVQTYVGRVKESHRRYRRHSTFWVGLYGELWLSSLELCPDLVAQLMRLKPNKRVHFQRGQRAAKLIQSAL